MQKEHPPFQENALCKVFCPYSRGDLQCTTNIENNLFFAKENQYLIRIATTLSLEELWGDQGVNARSYLNHLLFSCQLP